MARIGGIAFLTESDGALLASGSGYCRSVAGATPYSKKATVGNAKGFAAAERRSPTLDWVIAAGVTGDLVCPTKSAVRFPNPSSKKSTKGGIITIPGLSAVTRRFPNMSGSVTA